MIHLGDITKMTHENTPVVDCVTFGSPCQDLSIAGKRQGLAGERSGLFMEAVRVIKEMRMYSFGAYPKFAVWENVPGAFSSNKGEDFRAVLEELARIKEASVSIPRPEKGKWAKAGFICGNGWSIAWRTFDAQFWGVPQRRKRIAVVMDFGGQRAGEILFERKSLSGDFEPCIPPWQGVARAVKDGFGTDDRCTTKPRAYTLKIRSGCEGGGKGALVQTEKSATLSTLRDQTLFVYQGTTETDEDCRKVYDARGNGSGDCCPTLTGDHENRITDYTAVVIEPTVYCLQGNGIDRADTAGCNGKGWTEDVCYTLNTIDRPAVAYLLNDQGGSNISVESGSHSPTLRAESHGHEPTVLINAPYQSVTGPLMANSHPGSYSGQDAYNDMFVVAKSYNFCDQVSQPLLSRMCKDFHIVTVPQNMRWIVRRLTPTECERLQGFPDGWTDIGEWMGSKGKLRKTVDSARYKAIGNSIALPQWWWITCKMATYLPKHATLGSLFDGIGGFPLVWETLHGKGTAIWASEIEEFPIAVTKKHFGGSE